MLPAQLLAGARALSSAVRGCTLLPRGLCNFVRTIVKAQAQLVLSEKCCVPKPPKSSLLTSLTAAWWHTAAMCCRSPPCQFLHIIVQTPFKR